MNFILHVTNPCFPIWTNQMIVTLTSSVSLLFWPKLKLGSKCYYDGKEQKSLSWIPTNLTAIFFFFAVLWKNGFFKSRFWNSAKHDDVTKRARTICAAGFTSRHRYGTENFSVIEFLIPSVLNPVELKYRPHQKIWLEFCFKTCLLPYFSFTN